MKLYFSLFVTAMLTIGVSSTVGAQSARVPSPIELMCDGLYTMFGTQAVNVAMKGVLVVVGSSDAQIYDLPGSFGNYRTGMKMRISEKNPARIFLDSAEGRPVTASINRLNGEISVSRHASPGGKMLEYFSGNCRNKRQMF
jgi:hypothetical protein